LFFQVWDYNATELELRNRRNRLGATRWGDYGEEEEEAETLAPGVIATVTSDNIQKAKDFVNNLSANGGNWLLVPLLCGCTAYNKT
jgi:hypothetical protein